MLEYYLHIDPNKLSDEEWAEKIAQLADIRKRKEKTRKDYKFLSLSYSFHHFLSARRNNAMAIIEIIVLILVEFLQR